jgi:hypothetical protein
MTRALHARRRLLALLSAALVLSLGAGAQAQDTVLPVFDFMGDDTETPTTRTTLNGSQCTRDGATLECNDHADPSMGGVTLDWLSLSYNDGLLFRAMGSLDSRRYMKLLEAFTAKFGEPVMSVEKVQARSGASFDNTVATWPFRGGELRFLSIGTRVDKSLFLFVSTANEPPSEGPTVDF